MVTYCGHVVAADAGEQIVCAFCRRAYDTPTSFSKHMYAMHNDLLKAREDEPKPAGFWSSSATLWKWKVPASAI